MFVYIFCIVWATFFVFLAERQFRRIPVDVAVDKQKHSLLKDLLQRINNLFNKRTSQIVKLENKKQKDKISDRPKHIKVNLADKDEITIIIPNIRKDFSDSEKPHMVGQEIQRSTNLNIQNSFSPINKHTVGKNRGVIAQNIKVDFLDEKIDVQNDIDDETIHGSTRKNIEPKIIMDIIASKKYNNNKTESRKKTKISKSKDKTKNIKQQRMVGGEIFRKKKVESIVRSVYTKTNSRYSNIDIIRNKNARPGSSRVNEGEKNEK